MKKLKLFYASSISFPSSYVNRLQTLNTSQALFDELGDNFTLGGFNISKDNGIYEGDVANFFSKKSFIISWKTLKYIKSNNFNTVYSREHGLLFAMMIYNKLFFHLPLRFYFEAHAIQKDIRLGFVLRRCAATFCVSKGLADDLLKKSLNIKTVVTRNGVDTIECSISQEAVNNMRNIIEISENSKVVSYIGSVGTHSWKGEDIFLDSRKYISDRRVLFVVAGVKAVDIDNFRSVYEKEDVKILGYLNKEDVFALEQVSDILVLPNKHGDSESERHTSPIKMFSYMRSGTPIVASKLPSIIEVLSEKTAFLCAPGNSSELADTISYVLAHPIEGSERANNAKKEVKQYTWKRKAKIIIGYLNM